MTVKYTIIICIYLTGIVLGKAIKCERTNQEGCDELLCHGGVPSEALLQNVRSLNVVAEVKVFSDQLFEHQQNLEKLNFSACDIHEIEPNAFTKNEKLTTLVLSFNKLDIIYEYTFSNLLSLKHLFLNGNEIKVIIEGSFKNLKELQELNLADNKLLEMPGELPLQLKKLNLFNNEIEMMSLEKVKNLDELQMLNICGNEITTWSVRCVLPKLKHLCIGDKIINSGGSYSNSTSIETLQISAKHLKNTYLNRSLQETIRSLSNLIHLHIENYEINTFEFLEDLRYMNSLTLDNVRWGEKEITFFPVNLEKLIVIQSPKIAEHFLNLQGSFKQLVFLSLQNNTISEIPETQTLRTMKNLDLSLNPLNCEKEKLLWMYQKINRKELILDNINLVRCNKPLTVMGKTFLEALKTYVVKDDKDSSQTSSKYANEDINSENNSPLNTSHLLQGILLFLIFLICFLTIMTICNKMLYKLHKEHFKQNNPKGPTLTTMDEQNFSETSNLPTKNLINSTEEKQINKHTFKIESEEEIVTEKFKDCIATEV